jgi:hypothetical protein
VTTTVDGPSERTEDPPTSSVVAPEPAEAAGGDRWWGPDVPLTLLEAVAVPFVFAVSVAAAAALVLAWADAHSPTSVLIVTLVALAAGLAVVWARGWPRLRPSWAWLDLGVAAGLVVVASVLFFPGFELAAKNRDPGVYVNHAVAIARTGSVSVPDPSLEVDLPDEVSGLPDEDDAADASVDEGALAGPIRTHRGFSVDPDAEGNRLPSFFHLWPAVMATAMDVAGVTGLFNVGPAIAVASVVLVFLAGRRAFGLPAGAVAAGLLTVNMIQVWQARYPTAETLGQFFFVGGLASLLIAMRTRWYPAAAVGGIATGMFFLARPEGLYVVLLSVAAGLGLLAVGRFGPVARWFGIGLLPVTALGLYQAYVRNDGYASKQQGFIGSSTLLKGVGAVVLVAALVWLARRMWRPLRRWVAEVEPGRLALVVGLVGAVAFAAYLVVAWNRREFFGLPHRVRRGGERVRSYDEMNLERLTWFITVPGLVVASAAIAYGAVARWRTAWLAVVPGILVAPVLLWEPRIAPTLMWWGRRYHPVVLVTLLLLVGAAVGAALVRRGWLGWILKPVAVALVVFMALSAADDTREIVHHREFDGSLEVVDTLEAAAGDDRPVFVWQATAPQVANFAITPVTWLGLPSVIGPSRVTEESLRVIERAFGGRPVLLVNNTDRPPSLAEDVVERVARLDQVLTTLEITYESVPDEQVQFPMDLTVWRLRPP